MEPSIWITHDMTHTYGRSTSPEKEEMIIRGRSSHRQTVSKRKRSTTIAQLAYRRPALSSERWRSQEREDSARNACVRWTAAVRNTDGLEAFCLFIYYYSLRFFLIVSLDSLIFHYPAITKTKQMEYYGWRQNALIRSLFLFCFAVAICFHAFSVLLFCFVYGPDFRPLVISRSGDID